jgi:hypothetical protein
MSSGGGHGSSWIVTYSDMITLLMACFIMIITFASKEPEKLGQKKDSLVGGRGGSGVAGAMHELPDQDAVIWRERPLSSRDGKGKSENPAMYSDPGLPTTSEVMRALENVNAASINDSYSIRLPLALLFQSGDRLSPSATEIFHGMGRHIRQLPFDLLIQVDDAKYLSKAMAVAQFLMLKESIYPARLAVGTRTTAESWNASLSITCVRQH